MAIPGGDENAGIDASAAAEQPPAESNRRGVFARLWSRAFEFDFFQTVRLLGKRFPQRSPVGKDFLPGDEVARFKAHLSLAFPPSEIHELKTPPGEDRPVEITVAFMGLTGPSGVLPRYYTELLIERSRQKDRALRDFLDLFNHRLISLFYRAWEKYRFWISAEQAELAGRNELASGEKHYRAFVMEERPRLDPMADCLLNLVGMGHPTLRYSASARDRLQPRTRIDDHTLRFYAGLFAQQHRSASGLERLLGEYFSLPVEVMQFRGQWLRLEPENQTFLLVGGNVRVGANVVLGERVWEMQSKFRVRLGPIDYAQFRDLLPIGTAFQPLEHLTRFYAGPTWDIEMQLVLLAAETPACRLGDTCGGARLGWDAWIHCRPFARDPDDAVLALQDFSDWR